MKAQHNAIANVQGKSLAFSYTVGSAYGERGNFHYSVELSSCVSHVSRALNLSGIFNVGIHPYLLNAQMYLWSRGIRPWFVCNYIPKAK